jgi:hypothetical protein
MEQMRSKICMLRYKVKAVSLSPDGGDGGVMRDATAAASEDMATGGEGEVGVAL